MAGRRLTGIQERYQSSFSRRLRHADGASDTTLLKELYRSDSEGVIRLFESQPSLHTNSAALSEYIKALVSVDRLDGSELLRTLQRGLDGLLQNINDNLNSYF